MKRSIVFIAVTLSLCAAACQPEQTQSPTKGTLELIIPESIEPVMMAEVNQFMDLYRQNGADIRTRIGTTESAIDAFVSGSLRLVFVTRALTEQEKARVRESSETLVELAVAYDAVVAVNNVKNPADQITVAELRGILSGSITRWEKLSRSGGMRGAIRVYYEDSSDVSLYLRRRLLAGAPARGLFINTGSSLQTLRSVIQDRQSIGFVGVDWLDSAKVPAKVLEVAASRRDADTTYKPPVESIGRYYSVHPANVYRSYYPLKRTIYMYSRSARGDIATGFGTYVANKEGQRIFLNRNLVPGTQPIRLRPSF